MTGRKQHAGFINLFLVSWWPEIFQQTHQHRVWRLVAADVGQLRFSPRDFSDLKLRVPLLGILPCSLGKRFLREHILLVDKFFEVSVLGLSFSVFLECILVFRTQTSKESACQPGWKRAGHLKQIPLINQLSSSQKFRLIYEPICVSFLCTRYSRFWALAKGLCAM